jgi:hypothetical protein
MFSFVFSFTGVMRGRPWLMVGEASRESASLPPELRTRDKSKVKNVSAFAALHMVRKQADGPYTELFLFKSRLLNVVSMRSNYRRKKYYLR